jgi:hypothetical protein
MNMVRMIALKPWINSDEEGSVSPGTEFEARESRARELRRAGLAIPAVGDGSRIKVKADPPADGSPPPKRKRPGRRALVQLASGVEFVRMLDLTADIHARYCATWGAEFIAHRESRPRKAARPPHWRKVDVIGEALDQGFDQVLWLDADSIIVDGTANIFAACTWGLGICACHDAPTVPRHLNSGVLWFNHSSEVIAFVAAWNAMPNKMGEDQSAYEELMTQRRWRSLLTICPNRYNCVETAMEAPNPVVRSFHGDRERTDRMSAYIAKGTDAVAA